METVANQNFTPIDQETRSHVETVCAAFPLLSPALAEHVFPPLEQITRPTVPTDAAAYYLNRQPQTLRAWASTEHGPIRPVRINGRLAWRVADLLALLNGDAK